MEEHFFARYDDFLRVWPEWCSSGIWSPPYPGSRRAGGMVDYEYLPLTPELVERFKAWQVEYNNSPPVGPVELDWARAVLTWQLGGLSHQGLVVMRGTAWALVICFAAVTALAFKYAFVVPIIFSILILFCLTAAAWLSAKPV